MKSRDYMPFNSSLLLHYGEAWNDTSGVILSILHCCYQIISLLRKTERKINFQFFIVVTNDKKLPTGKVYDVTFQFFIVVTLQDVIRSLGVGQLNFQFFIVVTQSKKSWHAVQHYVFQFFIVVTYIRCTTAFLRHPFFQFFIVVTPSHNARTPDSG